MPSATSMKPSTTFTELSHPPLLGSFLSIEGKKAKDSERQREGYGEGQHRHDGTPELPGGGFDQHRADDGSGARERHQHERQGHEEDACKAFGVGFRVGFVHHPRGHRDLESSEERCGEDHEYQEEEDVREPVRRQPVEDVGRHGVAAHDAGDHDDGRDRQRVERHDEEPVHTGADAAQRGTSGAFHEERDGHRDHREHAGGQQGRKAPEDGFDNQRPKRTSARGILLRGGDLRGKAFLNVLFRYDRHRTFGER